MGHIEPTRLIDLAGNTSLLQQPENDHLNECEDCAQLLRTFKRKERTTHDILKKSTDLPFKQSA